MAKSAVEAIDRHVGSRLKKLRQQHDLSASQVADAVGSSQQQVSRYENGHNKISAAQLFALACYFRVPISWFFLDFEMPLATMVNESKGTYDSLKVNDEIEIIKSRWPELSSAERVAVLNLLDAFLG